MGELRDSSLPEEGVRKSVFLLERSRGTAAHSTDKFSVKMFFLVFPAAGVL
jgi:hypothetical protein